MNGRWHSISRVAVLVTAVALAASAAWAGEIRGTVHVAGGSSGNVAVWIGAIPGKGFPAPARQARVDQRHMRFIPHVLVIQKGTSVEFINSEPTLHNVYWPWISGNKGLARNLGTRPMGQKLAFTFNNTGIVPLLCNVHSEMYGYIVVVSTPYFATTSASGSFVIRGVPPGQYTLKVWSEKGSYKKVQSQAVKVGAGVTTLQVSYRP